LKGEFLQRENMFRIFLAYKEIIFQMRMALASVKSCWNFCQSSLWRQTLSVKNSIKTLWMSRQRRKIDLRADPEIDDVVSISALTRLRVGCVMRKSYIAKISMTRRHTRSV